MAVKGVWHSVVDGMKKCAKCAVVKPVAEFHRKSRKDGMGPGPYCKPCKAALKVETRERLSKKPDLTIEARFWPKVDKRGPDDCWNWLGALSNRGYGAIYYQGADTPAHRVSMFLAGHVFNPKTHVVDHKCKNIRCVNPRHLRICTQIENTTIYADRSRQFKLNEHIAAEIRQRYLLGERPKDLAAEYGVSITHVCTIGKGKVWKNSVLERGVAP